MKQYTVVLYLDCEIAWYHVSAMHARGALIEGVSKARECNMAEAIKFIDEEVFYHLVFAGHCSSLRAAPLTFQQFAETKNSVADVGKELKDPTCEGEAGIIYNGYPHISVIKVRYLESGHEGELYNLQLDMEEITSSDLGFLERKLYDWAIANDCAYPS